MAVTSYVTVQDMVRAYTNERLTDLMNLAEGTDVAANPPFRLIEAINAANTHTDTIIRRRHNLPWQIPVPADLKAFARRAAYYDLCQAAEKVSDTQRDDHRDELQDLIRNVENGVYDWAWTDKNEQNSNPTPLLFTPGETATSNKGLFSQDLGGFSFE